MSTCIRCVSDIAASCLTVLLAHDCLHRCRGRFNSYDCYCCTAAYTKQTLPQERTGAKQWEHQQQTSKQQHHHKRFKYSTSCCDMYEYACDAVPQRTRDNNARVYKQNKKGRRLTSILDLFKRRSVATAPSASVLITARSDRFP